MHHAARRVVERVAPVHRGAVVPQQQIADAPAVLVAQVGPLDVRPQRVEQRVGFRRREALDIGIAPPPEKQRAARR